MMKISDFQVKDVVNVANGKKLGHIADLEINLSTGKIESLIIPGPGKMLGFFARESDIVIPWRNIVKIGTDVILVRYMDAQEAGEYIKEPFDQLKK
ncbi:MULTISPECIES: YlmC/YmxH family sporulation protein [Fictibacillus]|uniref:YlmC/YmxH family sporulation protein n=1 Tax=Fictibacillus terranigra TaxID=3058424 RepID=A0ABT8E6I1_9BACL|nr:YlmC/YmxH family sporulation protein [Fictibacillus sp. CENA-BCM004]MDN4073523.1 YlmC/YmxH family sporulation protein [Fictibacillus sp. CENA-BCM004]